MNLSERLPLVYNAHDESKLDRLEEQNRYSWRSIKDEIISYNVNITKTANGSI